MFLGALGAVVLDVVAFLVDDAESSEDVESIVNAPLNVLEVEFFAVEVLVEGDYVVCDLRARAVRILPHFFKNLTG